MAPRLVLTSRWRLECPAADVWALLVDVEQWPRWWRHVRHARLLERGAASPLGDVVDLHWRSALGHPVRVRMHTLAVEPLRLIEGQATGGLSGLGTWMLEPAGERAVDVSYRWELVLDRRWLRALALALAPLFAWNHFVVMRSAARGMSRHLGCRWSRHAEWAGAARTLRPG